MSLFLYETKENLPTTITNGDVYYTDSGDIYIDKDSKRYKLNLNSFPVTLQNLTKSLTEIKEETPNPPEPSPDNTPYTFAFIADTHESRYASQLVASIESKKAPLLAHAGDYVNYGSANLLKGQVNNYSGNYTYLITRGNHDGTADSTYHSFLDESEVLSAMGGKSYYYKDITSKKIRFIVLNTEDRDLPTVASDPQHYYGIGVSQMKWLCGTALQVSEPGWSAILLMHTPLCPLESMDGWSKLQWDEKTSGYGRWYIASKVISACNNATRLTTAYTEGDANASMDYTFNGNMTIIAALCGHVHADNIVKVNGVPNVSIEATKEVPCYDLVTVDKTNKKLTFDRYDVNGRFTSSREASWGAPNGANVGTAENGSSSGGNSGSSGGSLAEVPETGAFSFSAIVFENGVLRYIAKDRTAATNENYLAKNLDARDTIKIQSGSGLITFSKGLANVPKMTTVASDGRTKFAVFFSNGKYVGYNSNPEASSYDHAATSRKMDFFGVPQQSITIT